MTIKRPAKIGVKVNNLRKQITEAALDTKAIDKILEELSRLQLEAQRMESTLESHALILSRQTIQRTTEGLLEKLKNIHADFNGQVVREISSVPVLKPEAFVENILKIIEQKFSLSKCSIKLLPRVLTLYQDICRAYPYDSNFVSGPLAFLIVFVYLIRHSEEIKKKYGRNLEESLFSIINIANVVALKYLVDGSLTMDEIGAEVLLPYSTQELCQREQEFLALIDWGLVPDPKAVQELAKEVGFRLPPDETQPAAAASGPG
jgi:hypothetical protein